MVGRNAGMAAREMLPAGCLQVGTVASMTREVCFFVRGAYEHAQAHHLMLAHVARRIVGKMHPGITRARERGDRVRMIRLKTVCLVTAVCGCAISTRDGRPINDSRFGDVTMKGDEIDAQHARNAWEFLRVRVPRYTYIEDRSGRAVAIRGHRGRSSILLDGDSPIVVVDGARLVAFDVLQQMPTDAIDRIQVLSGLRGTSWEGTGASAGVIYIYTRSGSN